MDSNSKLADKKKALRKEIRGLEREVTWYRNWAAKLDGCTEDVPDWIQGYAGGTFVGRCRKEARESRAWANRCEKRLGTVRQRLHCIAASTRGVSTATA